MVAKGFSYTQIGLSIYVFITTFTDEHIQRNIFKLNRIEVEKSHYIQRTISIHRDSRYIRLIYIPERVSLYRYEFLANLLRGTLDRYPANVIIVVGWVSVPRHPK